MGELLCEVEANLIRKRCSKIVRFTEGDFDIYQMPASSWNRGIIEWIPCIELIRRTRPVSVPRGGTVRTGSARDRAFVPAAAVEPRGPHLRRSCTPAPGFRA